MEAVPSADPLLSNGRFNDSEFQQPTGGAWKQGRRPPQSSGEEELATLLDTGLRSQEFQEPAGGVWNSTVQLKVTKFFLLNIRGLSLNHFDRN